MKKFVVKTMFTMAFAITMLCTSIIPAAAQEESVTSAMQSCSECGATGYYRTAEYGERFLFLKLDCIHGHISDVIYARHVYEVTRCSYCNYLLKQDYIKTEYEDRICVD